MTGRFGPFIIEALNRKGMNIKPDIHLGLTKFFHRRLKEFMPALLVLALTVVLSVFLGQFTFLKEWEAVTRGFYRFARLTVLLCIPLWLLSPICSGIGWVIRRRKILLIKIKNKQRTEILPQRNWLIRPFQGIGILFLFSTKLLGLLQIIGGQTVTSSILSTDGHFLLGRLLAVTGTTVFVSLFLSTLWTLDDLGIRYFNRRDYEIKMIGKYVGTLMPCVFGFYGVLSLFGLFPTEQALMYLLQIVIILYPPFVVFSVLHSRYLQSRKGALI